MGSLKEVNRPIRILHVFGALNRGGAETMIMNIYRNIDRSKIQFDFIIHTDEKCDFFDEIKSLGGVIYTVPRFKGFNFLQYIIAWNKFFQKNKKYKIIHAHMRSTASIYLRIANKFGLVRISHSHSTSNGFGIQAIIKNIMQYPIRYYSDYLFACSQKAGEWLFGKRKSKGKKFFIVKNAIEIEKYTFNMTVRNEVRKKLGFENEFVIGHVGRFCDAKNHDFLIDIFEGFLKYNNNSFLLLIGDGELKDSIYKLVNDKGLSEHVRFLGNSSDVSALLQGIDYFVFPSFFEGLGISLIEAQAAGIECLISSNIPEEVNITDLVQRVSLDITPEKWAEIIYKTNYKARQDMSIEIKKSGYDVKYTAKWLEEFYLAQWGI